MNSIRRFHPTELIYINLQCIKLFIGDLDIPKAQLKREQNKISKERVSSFLPEVIFDSASGNYLLVGGYTTLLAYQSIHNPDTLIPCKAYYHLAEDEYYLLTLDWAFKNNITNWYNRHELVTKLLNNYQYTKTAWLHFWISR